MWLRLTNYIFPTILQLVILYSLLVSVLSNPRADHMVIRRQADEAQNNQFFLFGQVLDSFSKLSQTEKLSNVDV